MTKQKVQDTGYTLAIGIMVICTLVVGILIGESLAMSQPREDTSVQTTCNFVCLTNHYEPARGVIIDMSKNKGQCVCMSGAVEPFDVMP